MHDINIIQGCVPKNEVRHLKPTAPKSLDSIVGQTNAIARLKGFFEVHRTNNSAPGHILLIGQDGTGKRTLAAAIASELRVPFQCTEACDLVVKGDLTAILTNVRERQVLLISDLHRMKTGLARILADALENSRLDIIIGVGPAQRLHTMELKPFTFIGTVERERELPGKLPVTFDLKLELDRYEEDALRTLAEQISTANAFTIEPKARDLLVANSERTPRAIEDLIRKTARTHGDRITEEAAAEVLSRLGALRPTGSKGVNDIDGMSGVDFENFIVKLIQGMGFRAETTKATGDGGIDIIAHLEKPLVGGRYLFQCKRFNDEGLVGAPLVREFYGAVSADRAAVKGVFVTTSRFTEQAREFAEQVNIELIDGDKLRELIAEHSARRAAASV